MSEIISELNDYMLTNSYINKFLTQKNETIFYDILKKNKNDDVDMYKILRNNIKNENNEIKYNNDKKVQLINYTAKEDIFEPEFYDKIFWCFYIILNGYNSYELIKTNSFKEEKDFKIKTIENINNYKEELKKYKLKINEIKDELLNEKKISVKTLFSLCIIYKLNIMYINMNKGIYFNCFGNNIEYKDKDNENENNIKFFNLPYIIIENSYKTFILNDNSIDNINIYKNKYYCIENISKPIKSISNYTIAEIHELCNKFNIKIKTDDNKKINKIDLYNAIANKLE